MTFENSDCQSPLIIIDICDQNLSGLLHYTVPSPQIPYLTKLPQRLINPFRVTPSWLIHHCSHLKQWQRDLPLNKVIDLILPVHS